MKKLISLLLALVMLLSLGVTAFAIEKDPETGELYEIFDMSSPNFIVEYPSLGWTFAHYDNEFFRLESDDTNGPSCGGGTDRYTRIIPNEGTDLIITRVEAQIYSHGTWYEGVGVTHGTRRETGMVETGSWVHIDDVNSRDFAFEGGSSFSFYGKIKVYYECNEHIWGEDNHCEACDITKCEYEGHSYDKNNTCINCGVTKCEVEGHNYDENNTCINCGMTKCKIEGHIYESGVCTRCRHECENEFHNGVYACPDCGMEFDPTQGNPLISGSTVSDGSLTIICTIAAAAVFGISGYLLGKKKKVKTEE